MITELKAKERYEAPTMLVVEIKAEGIVCTSDPTNGTGNGFPDGWDFFEAPGLPGIPGLPF